MKYQPPLNGDQDDPNRPYVDADPARGVEGSIPTGKSIEQPQREIHNFIEDSGLTPDENNLRQLTPAVRRVATAARRPLATASEAQRGTNNTKIMTPLRTREAIYQERQKYPFFRLTKNQTLKGTDGQVPDTWSSVGNATYHLVETVRNNIAWEDRTENEQGLLRALGRGGNWARYIYKPFNIWRMDWRGANPNTAFLHKRVPITSDMTVGAVTKLLAGRMGQNWAEGATLNEWRITGHHNHPNQNLAYRHVAPSAYTPTGSILFALPAVVAGTVPIEDGLWGDFPYIGDYERDNNSVFPVGSLIFGVRSINPSGFLFCNGARVNKDRYERLFSVIGHNFALSHDDTDGDTLQFRLPDLRNKFIKGSQNQNGIGESHNQEQLTVPHSGWGTYQDPERPLILRDRGRLLVGSGRREIREGLESISMARNAVEVAGIVSPKHMALGIYIKY